MPNNNTPVNDRISKDFYEAFWNDLKDPLLNSFCKAEIYQNFSAS